MSQLRQHKPKQTTNMFYLKAKGKESSRKVRTVIVLVTQMDVDGAF